MIFGRTHAVRADIRRMKGDNIATRLVDFGAAVVMLTRSLQQDRAGKLIVDG